MAETFDPRTGEQTADVEDRVVRLLASGLTMATAESCTGGLVAGSITSLGGSSAVFQGGVVSYSNDVKEHVLGVDPAILQTVGAVSRECALAMCKGAKRLTGSDVAVSTTGIAGPTGDVPGKPLGTVWFGVTSPKGECSVLRHFKGDRKEVRHQAVVQALDLLLWATDC